MSLRNTRKERTEPSSAASPFTLPSGRREHSEPGERSLENFSERGTTLDVPTKRVFDRALATEDRSGESHHLPLLRIGMALAAPGYLADSNDGVISEKL